MDRATKGDFYSTAVLSVLLACCVILVTLTILFIPILGFIVGLMFAPLSIIFMSFVKTINTLNIFVTGLITPMFMFLGIIFPITDLPKWIQCIIEIFPLVYAVNIECALCENHFRPRLIMDLIYCIVFIVVALYCYKKNKEKTYELK